MQRLQCDVLVIGAGLAGVWAAARAKELAPSVILVDIARVGKSGKSAFSGAGILCPEPSDDMDVWHKEISEKGQYLNDQDWVRIVLEEQPARLKDMGDWGLTFERDEKGKVVRHVGLNHVTTRITTVDSLEMLGVMRKRLENTGVTLLERVMITGLATSDGNLPTAGSVVGAVGFHTRTGEGFAINAGATVVASGSTVFLWGTGEGIAQGYRAGADVSNMEFARCFDEMGFEDRYIGVHLNTYQRLGMRLFNRAGERFMERYLPDLKERGKREDLGLAIVCEGMQGRGPIHIDLTHLDKDTINKLYTLPTTRLMVNTMKDEGIDFRKGPVKYVVTSGPVCMVCGGIRVNIFGEASLPGLYAAGEASGMPAHGTYSVGGVNLASCCVGGYRAGEYAARYARENGRKPVVDAQARHLIREATRPLKATSGIKPDQLFDEIHTYLSPARIAVFRDADSIDGVLGRIREWKAKLRTIKANDVHDLVKANKLPSYLQCTELVFRGSAVREETRANNIRIDFPYKDNINWLQWVVQSNGGKETARSTQVPVPLYRYPAKPKEYARVPANLPFKKNPEFRIQNPEGRVG
ncbi:MAG: FAD-binding protein [Chloroflexi bacterium]|nr:FAD-binding protein [Chloroflexota bacterium]